MSQRNLLSTVVPLEMIKVKEYVAFIDVFHIIVTVSRHW